MNFRKIRPSLRMAIVAMIFCLRGAAQMTTQGPTAIPQLNTDYYVGTVPGFNASIQSAVTKLCAISSGPAANGSRVIIPAGSPADGTAGFTISAVTGGCVKVAIEDRRTIPPGEYLWTPTGPGSPAYLPQSTGSSPGGAIYEGQANPGTGNTMLGNNLFSNAGKTVLTTLSAFSAKTTNAVINTDLNGGVATTMGACTGCAFAVPNTSTDVSPYSVLNGSAASSFFGHDYRTGWDYEQNIAATTTFPEAYGHNCVYGPTGVTSSGSGGALGGCETNYFAKTGGGVSNSNQWTNFQAHQDNGFFLTSGQSFGRAYNYFFGKLGDSIIDESNSSFREGATGFSDEAVKFYAHHLVDAGNQWGTVNVAGANSTSTGIATIGVNITGGVPTCGNKCLMDGGFLMFEDEPIDTTTLTAQTVDSTGANLVTTSTTHAVSTWQATLTAPCGAFIHRDLKQKYDCAVNVTVNTANPTSGSVASMVDGLTGGMYETAMVTTDTANPTPPTGTGALTVVLWLSELHGAGSKIMMGGTAGGVGTFANGLTDPTTNQPGVTSWAVGGSPDATHEYIVTNYKQGQQGTMQVQIPPIIAATTQVAVTCTGTSVTAPAGTFQNVGSILNIVIQGTEAFVASGFSGAGMNGAVTNVHVNGDTSATWTPPGGTCTAGSSAIGGTITVTNSQGFVEYCGAEVTAIVDGSWTVTGIPFFTPTGSLHTDPMSCTAAASERVIQPDRVEEEAQMYTDLFTINSSAVGNNRVVTMQTGGIGMSGVPLYEHSTSDNANPTTGVYLGHGGRNAGSVYLHETAPNAGMYKSTYAALNGAPEILIGCPLEGCSATQPDTPVVEINGASGTQGKLWWQGSQDQWWFDFAQVAFGNHQELKLGVWPTNSNYQFMTFNGTVGAGSLGLLGGFGDNNLYHILPSGGAETWRWNSLTVNTGLLTATNFDYPSFSEGGVQVPTVGANTFTGAQTFSAGLFGTTYTPLPGTTAPSGACTVAGTLEVTADGHGTYCKAGTLVWTTLY